MTILELLEKHCPIARTISEETLFTLMEDNAETEYGKKYGFSTIHSVADYKRKVPFTDYNDYAEYVSRMTKGEKNILTAYPIDMYALTTGSSGTRKRIPISDRALSINVAYYYDLSHAVYKRYLDETTGDSSHEVKREIRLAMASEDHVEDGTLLTNYSGGVYIAIKEELLPNLCCPSEAMYGSSLMDYMYLKAFCALKGNDADMIGAPFMSSVSDFFYTIETNWQSLCQDIELGRLNPEKNIPAGIADSVNKAITPDPKRAEELREIFRQGFDQPIVKKIWPSFGYIWAIGTGSFSAYINKVRRYVGDTPLFMAAYGASEGSFAIATAFNQTDCVMVPESGYYEFIPEEDMGLPEDELKERTLSIGELEVGKNYEMVVTNLSGFYRYRIGDVITVTGFQGESPMICFAYRRNQMLNVTGEKTNEKHVQSAVDKLAKETGINVVEWTVYADYKTTPPHYVIFIETDPVIQSDMKPVVRDILEKGLADANDYYKEYIEDGHLGKMELVVLQPETYALYRDMLIYKGASSNQLKPVHVIDNLLKERFFFGLEEKDL